MVLTVSQLCLSVEKSQNRDFQRQTSLSMIPAVGGSEVDASLNLAARTARMAQNSGTFAPFFMLAKTDFLLIAAIQDFIS